VIHSLIQEKGKEKSPKWCQLVVTGSDRWQEPVWLVSSQQVHLDGVTRHECPGDPVRLCMLQGDPTPMTGWPGVVQTLKKKDDLASKVMRN
jgi:hypothetical protein